MKTFCTANIRQVRRRQPGFVVRAIRAGAWLAIFSCSGLVSCDAGRLGPDALLVAFPPGPDVAGVLNFFALEFAAPAYFDLEQSAAALDQAALEFQTAPGPTTLANLRTRWRASQDRLKTTEIIFFGPASDSSLYARLDCWSRGFTLCARPGDCATTIDGVIAGAGTINSASIEASGVRVRGLPAIEYLIYDDGAGDASSAAVVAALNGRRLQYLRAVAANVRDRSRDLRRAWDPASGNYARELTNAGAGGQFMRRSDALSWIVQQMILIVENVRDAKLGGPAGFTVKSAGVKSPALLESRFSRTSLADMRAALAGLRSVYTGEYGGRTGTGFSVIALDRNPDLDSQVRKALDANLAQIDAITLKYGDLETALAADAPETNALFASLKELLILVSADLVSASGTNPGASPNDGD
jgi:predicted lipoprotein